MAFQVAGIEFSSFDHDKASWLFTAVLEQLCRFKHLFFSFFFSFLLIFLSFFFFTSTAQVKECYIYRSGDDVLGSRIYIYISIIILVFWVEILNDE